MRQWRLDHMDRWREIRAKVARGARKRLRLEILRLLGNRCANPFGKEHPEWCNDSRCLEIDHINGGGTQERSSFKNMDLYYKHVLKRIKEGSHEYQLLCSNCNAIKRILKKENPSKY